MPRLERLRKDSDQNVLKFYEHAWKLLQLATSASYLDFSSASQNLRSNIPSHKQTVFICFTRCNASSVSNQFLNQGRLLISMLQEFNNLVKNCFENFMFV
jgi:hypothetical protein